MRFGSTALALTTFAAVFIPKDLLPQSAEPSRILTNGNGEVTLAPDWATLALEATVEDSSALAAATADRAGDRPPIADQNCGAAGNRNPR